jgi:hypothetical protein
MVEVVEESQLEPWPNKINHPKKKTSAAETVET